MISRARRRTCSAALAAWVFGATQLCAQELPDERGLDVRLFRPPMDAHGFLATNGAHVPASRQLGAAVFLDVGFNAAPTTEGELVDYAATGLAMASFGLKGVAAVGLALPVQSVSDSSALAADHSVLRGAAGALRSAGIGDLELGGKVRLSPARAPLGFAALVEVTLPTGQTTELRGEPGATVSPALIVEYVPVAALRAAVELGYRWIGGDGARLRVEDDLVEYDDQLAFGAALEVKPLSSASFLVDAYGTPLVRDLGKSGGTSLELALGAKLHVHDYITLIGAGALGIVRGVRGARVRALAGVSFAAAAADFDRDGYPARVDGCPHEAEDFDAFEDSDGCPDPDNDADGVPDAVDQCLNDPEDADGHDDHDGCPEGLIADSDGDGIDDYLDDDAETPGGNR